MSSRRKATAIRPTTTVEIGATPRPTQLFLADASSTEESSEGTFLYSPSRPVKCPVHERAAVVR
jgi:hypothetical protein